MIKILVIYVISVLLLYQSSELIDSDVPNLNRAKSGGNALKVHCYKIRILIQ